MRPAGQAVFVGLAADDTTLGFHDIVRSQLTLQGSYAYTMVDFEQAHEWLVSGQASLGEPAAVRPLRGRAGRVRRARRRPAACRGEGVSQPGRPGTRLIRMSGEETSELQQRTMKRVAARLMPALLVLYIIAYLDRVNVTFAQDKLESDLGFSGAVYGFGAGVFFIALLLPRGPEQPRAAPLRRAQVDRAHHDHLGDHLGLHAVRDRVR